MTKTDGSILKATVYLKSSNIVKIVYKRGALSLDEWSDIISDAMLKGNGIHLDDVFDVPHGIAGGAIEYFNIQVCGMYD